MNNSTPQQYSTVCPFIMVDDVEKQIDFLHLVFDGEVKGSLKNADGISVHGEVILGTSVIMLGRSSAELQSQPSMNYVYVNDANLVYEKALRHGATSLYAPDDKFYGIREAGFRDLHNNTWFIGQHLKDVSVEDIEKVFAGKKTVD